MKPFLTAAWKNLIFINYEVDPDILLPFLPPATEIDSFNNKCYVSLVGFMFLHTKVKGIAFPFHTNFEEFNLRFYVRFNEKGKYKRGVVFVKEIVPRRMISTVAWLLYGEHYYRYPMRNKLVESGDGLQIEYGFKFRKQWNYINALVEHNTHLAASQSEEEFITEHYWGYTKVYGNKTFEYEVRHPSWKIHNVKDFTVHCDVEHLYGKAFQPYLQQPPASVFMAEGSPVEIYPRKLVNTNFDL